MADKKISELDAITGANTAATDVFVVVDTSTGQTKKITREELNNAIEQDVLSSIDIDTINGDFTVNGNINLGDNNKAIFGAGSDFEIYHDGSNSWIHDKGTGNLNIEGRNVFIIGANNDTILAGFIDGAESRLYYNGSQKLATTSSGVDVTGSLNISTDGTGFAIDSSSNAYMVIDRGASNRRGELVFTTASTDVLNAPPLSATTDWALGVSDSDELAGDAFYISTQSGATAAKMVINRSGDVGIGTSSPSTNLHVSSSSDAIVRVTSADGNGAFLDLGDASDPDGGRIVYDSGSNLTFSTASTERVRINSSGAVGIGTSSPAAKIDSQEAYDTVSNILTNGTYAAKFGGNTAVGAAGRAQGIMISGRSGNTRGAAIIAENQGSGNGHDLLFATSADASVPAERLRITDTGLVGIGTSPADKLHVEGNIYLGASNRTIYTGGSGNLIFQNNTGNMIFSRSNGSSESMRIDTSGNLLVGKTSTSSAFTTAGVDLRPEGRSFMTRSAGPSLYLSRTTSDGNIVEFYKDGTTVGSIGSSANRLTIGTDDTGLIFSSLDYIRPWNPSTNSSRDNAIDLGGPSDRFEDLYLGGTAYVGTSVSPSTSDGSDTSRLSIGGGGDANSTGRGSLVQYHGNEHASAAGAMKHFMGNVSGSYISWHLGSGTEAMRIDSGGNVGIGTSSPDANSQLHIKKTGANAKITLETDESNDCYINFSGATSEASVGYEPTSNAIVFANAADGLTSNERMRIDSSGNVLVGTTGYTGNTTNSGGGIRSDGLAFSSVNGGAAAVLNRLSTDGDIALFRKDGSTVGSIGSYSGTGLTIASGGELRFFTSTSNEDMRLETDGDLHVDGNVVAYSTTISDIRLKKDIAPIEDAVTKVQQLNGCTFTYLKDDRKSAGLIAQDVEKVLPSAVIEDEAVFHGEEGETYKTVQYDQVIGLLVEAVKELKAEIEELKDGSPK